MPDNWISRGAVAAVIAVAAVSGPPAVPSAAADAPVPQPWPPLPPDGDPGSGDAEEPGTVFLPDTQWCPLPQGCDEESEGGPAAPAPEEDPAANGGEPGGAAHEIEPGAGAEGPRGGAPAAGLSPDGGGPGPVAADPPPEALLLGGGALLALALTAYLYVRRRLDGRGGAARHPAPAAPVPPPDVGRTHGLDGAWRG